MVHKGNEIIEIRDFLLMQLKDDFDLQEWRMLGYYLEKINPRDINTRFVKVYLEDYCSIMGIGKDANIPYLKNSTKKLLQKVVDGPDPDKKVVYSQTVLFQRSRLMEDEYGRLYFEFNAADDALPLMFDFKEHYIKAKGMNIFELNSPNQILMYFYICKQFGLGKKDIEVSVEELRDWLGIKPNEYQRFGDFNNWVLRTCEKALKEHSDLCFTYEKGKMGAHGKCETIKLHIKENKKIAKKMEAEALIEAASTNNNETNRKIIELCEKSFNKKLNGIELDWIQTWINEYGITEDIVKLAIKDNSFRTYMTIKNVDDTLTKWHENNITTVEAAKEFCENEHKKNIRNAARNKNNSNSVWPTGEEAGIVFNQSEVNNHKHNDIEEDDDIDILTLFDDIDDDPDI